MMADSREPTQTEFDNAEQAALDIMSTRYPSFLTKAGSVVRELLIRPFAYLYSWFTSNMEDTMYKSSMVYLSQSQATENERADLIASNYFVERLAGTRSRGAVTVTMSVPMLDLSAGAVFTAGGVTLMTERRTIATGSAYRLANDIQYVPVYPYADGASTAYYAVIPVVAAETGRIELPAGLPVELGFGNSIIDTETNPPTLTSPVTGGRDTETDAELMARARYNTAESGIGSYYGILKKLKKAPVQVLSLALQAGEDMPIYRARYNSVNINPGGMIDCYVKLQNQASVDTMTASAVEDVTQGGETVGVATFYDTAHAGLYGLLKLTVDGEDILNVGTRSYTVNVSFITHDPMLTDRGARLGSQQVMKVSCEALAGVSASSVHAVVAYLPGLYQLQQFMDQDENRFIGQDVQVKAAVPVAVGVACALKYQGTADEETLAAIKQAIADRINNYAVGTKVLNFSDIRDAVAASVQGAELRLPCTMSASTMLPDGSMDTVSSTSGLLNISSPVSKAYWEASTCYFSAVTDNIRLSI